MKGDKTPPGISTKRKTKSSVHWPPSTHQDLLPPSPEKFVLCCQESQAGIEVNPRECPCEYAGQPIWLAILNIQGHLT